MGERNIPHTALFAVTSPVIGISSTSTVRAIFANKATTKAKQQLCLCLFASAANVLQQTLLDNGFNEHADRSGGGGGSGDSRRHETGGGGGGGGGWGGGVREDRGGGGGVKEDRGGNDEDDDGGGI